MGKKRSGRGRNHLFLFLHIFLYGITPQCFCTDKHFLWWPEQTGDLSPFIIIYVPSLFSEVIAYTSENSVRILNIQSSSLNALYYSLDMKLSEFVILQCRFSLGLISLAWNNLYDVCVCSNVWSSVCPLSVLTCSHHFIDGDAGGVQLLGKLVHSLARVLICVGVYVGPDTGQTHCSSREREASVFVCPHIHTSSEHVNDFKLCKDISPC